MFVKALFLIGMLMVTPAMATESDMPGLPPSGVTAPDYNRALGDVLGTFLPSGTAPCGLEHDGSGNLYQTDLDGQIVYLIDTTGTVITSFSVGANSLNPIGVTTDGTNLFVTDGDGDDVDEYTSAGTYVDSFSVLAQTTFPEGITFNPNTGNLYVVNGSGGNVVIEYTLTGSLVATYPIGGSSPDGIAYDPVRNSYWVYDSGTDSVSHYDLSFTLLEAFPGPIAAGHGRGEGIAVIGDSCYVVGIENDIIVEFDLTGAVPVELQNFSIE